MQENFFIGNSKGEGRCSTYGKRRRKPEDADGIRAGEETAAAGYQTGSQFHGVD